MYGTSTYGSGSYGGIIEQQPIVVFNPTIFQIGLSIKEPVIFTEEIITNLSIRATLHQPSFTAINKSIVIKINTVDISNQVVFNSLSVSNNLYSEPNNASFEIIKSSTKSYIPTANDEVEIIDTGVTIFKGLLIKISTSMNGFSESYSLEFKDWTEELSNTLVAQTYTNQTVTQIITDIFSVLPTYDISNVTDTTVITQLVSDNIPITNALDKLAEMTNKYWYVSPNKEIFFFSSSDIPAPFGLTDTNGKYDYSSLIFDEDLTQIRNKVTIKGKGIAAVTVQDLTSQATYGLKEYYERDENILATNEATQKANAILTSYKNSIKIVSFRTLTEGLFAGQQITIQSTLRGINETLNIESINFRSTYQNRFYYEVKATSQRLGRIEDLFAKVQETPDPTPTISDQGNLQTVEFSAIDDETIQWSSGTIYLADGTSYSISADTSETLTGDHVIYFDKLVSLTTLQISTNFADGIGQGKIPLAYATKSGVATKGASIFPVGFGGKMQIDGGTHITERSIITDNIAANAITANEISVTNLSAISADIGTITAGTINGITITGSVIKTKGTGVNNDIWLNSATGDLEFYWGANHYANISIDSGSSLVYVANQYHQFWDNANHQLAVFKYSTTENLQLIVGGISIATGGTDIRWSSGRKIIDGGSSITIDGDLIPHADNQHQLGYSNYRWSLGNFEDINVDDITVNNTFSGCGSISGCAYIEVNLLNKEQVKIYKEKANNSKENHDKITDFEEGDVLVYSHNGLKKCLLDTCPCVTAVSDKRGMPIVLGAEIINVIGKISVNQFLVTSPVEGYARAWNGKENPPMGTVIAQAMEGKSDNEKGKIMAMIRKF